MKVVLTHYSHSTPLQSRNVFGIIAMEKAFFYCSDSIYASAVFLNTKGEQTAKSCSAIYFAAQDGMYPIPEEIESIYSSACQCTPGASPGQQSAGESGR